MAGRPLRDVSNKDLNGLQDDLARERHWSKAREIQLQEQERIQELLRQENKEISIELARQENRIKEANALYHEVSSENAALARQLHDTELQLQHARSELLNNSRVVEDLAVRQRLTDDLAQSNAQLKAENDELEGQVCELRNQLAETLTEQVQLEQNLSEQTAAIEELSDLVQSLESQLMDLRSADLEKSQRIDVLVRDVQELQNTSSISLMDPDSLRSELRGGRKLTECHVEELAKLVELEQNENDALQSTVAHLNATIAALESNVATQHDLQHHTAQLEHAVQELLNISHAVNAIVQTADTIITFATTLAKHATPHVRHIDDRYRALLEIHDLDTLPTQLCIFADQVASSIASLGTAHVKNCLHPKYGNLTQWYRIQTTGTALSPPIAIALTLLSILSVLVAYFSGALPILGAEVHIPT